MFKEIVYKIIHIITNPDTTWEKLLAQENYNSFLNRYLHPIIGLISVSTFIGGLWIIPDGGIEVALKNTLTNIITIYGGYYIASYILNESSHKFDILKDELKTQQFVGYASALLYLIVMTEPLLPNVPILIIFSLYTVYIVYIGYDVYIGGKEDTRMKFTVVATTAILLTPFLIKKVLSFLIKN